MYGQITNNKGENLYILIAASTNCIEPYIKVDTWEKCKEHLEGMTTEVNNSRFFVQLVHKKVDEESHKAEASMRCNKKDWSSDYFMYVTIESLYTEAW